MKSSLFAFAISSLLLASAGMTVYAAPPARKSADGLDLPAAAPERKFHSKVALGSVILGQKPEEVGRVFNTKKSALLLAKRTTHDLGCDWFAINVDGADVAGMNLTDGRVSKVVLFYEVATPAKVANLRKQVEGSADQAVKVTLTPIEHDKKHSLMIVFAVDPIEFYLAIHPVEPKIASALREHTWLSEMTDDQALMIGDGPGNYAALFASDNKGDGTGAGTVFADPGGPDIRMEFHARNKQDAKEQALKKHKNLKELTKVGGAVEGTSKK